MLTNPKSRGGEGSGRRDLDGDARGDSTLPIVTNAKEAIRHTDNHTNGESMVALGDLYMSLFGVQLMHGAFKGSPLGVSESDGLIDSEGHKVLLGLCARL
jgi:hypothetical protein